MDFVQLNRTFLEFQEKDTDESAIDRSLWARYFNREITWPTLLKKTCVVVLGEAGIGKTREFKEQAKALSIQGLYAFFVDIGTLANDGLTVALSQSDFEHLERWRNGSSEAIFFLDSVDEARLTSSKYFKRALKKL